MKYIVKKILKETYEQQVLINICNRMTTGSNKNSEKYMYDLKNFIFNSDLPDYVKEKSKKIFDSWEDDMDKGVRNNFFGSMTGDSESDESNTYFVQLQSLICSNYMEAMN